MNAPVAGAALRTRSVRLRPVRAADTDWLYELLVVDQGSRWRYRGRSPSPQDFAGDLWRGVLTQFVTEDHTGAPCGLVGGYNASLQASHCHVFAVGAADRGRVVTEGAGLLIGWLFDQFDFAKIWIEAPAFNLSQFASIQEVAQVEGQLTNFEYWQGRFWDLYVLSIGRQRWDEVLAPRLRRRTSPMLQPAGPREGPLDDLESLLAELLPLDSLGAIELLSHLEERLDREVDAAVLDGLSGLRDVVAAAQLVRTRVNAGPNGTQQSSLTFGRGMSGGKGHEPSSVELTSS